MKKPYEKPAVLRKVPMQSVTATLITMPTSMGDTDSKMPAIAENLSVNVLK